MNVSELHVENGDTMAESMSAGSGESTHPLFYLIGTQTILSHSFKYTVTPMPELLCSRPDTLGETWSPVPCLRTFRTGGVTVT